MLALVLGTAGTTFGYDYDATRRGPGLPRRHRRCTTPAYTVDVGSRPVPLPAALRPGPASRGCPWGSGRRARWVLAMAACFLVGVALLPVRHDVRWPIVLVAA